jgi:hypothetical protein
MPYQPEQWGGEGSKTGSWAEYQAYLQKKYGVSGGATKTGALWNLGKTQNQQQYNEAIFRGEREGQDATRGLLGGPVGWLELAMGKGLLGGNDPFDGSTYSGAMTEDVYNSMSPQEWQAFAKMDGGSQEAFIQQRTKQIERYKNDPERLKREKEEAELVQKQKDRQLAQDDMIAKVRAFADEMNMPIEELMQKDGFAQALNRHTFQNAMGSGMNRGAGIGGLSQANADMATKKALLGYHMQRQQQGQQALSNAFGMVQNQNMWAEDIARYNQGLNLQFQQAEAARRQQEYQQGLGQAQGFAGMVGGIMGGIWGGPTGAAMGQQIGSNMGGQRYQGNNPYTPYQFTYPNSTRPKAGGSAGGGGLGGNY